MSKTFWVIGVVFVFWIFVGLNPVVHAAEPLSLSEMKGIKGGACDQICNVSQDNCNYTRTCGYVGQPCWSCPWEQGRKCKSKKGAECNNTTRLCPGAVLGKCVVSGNTLACHIENGPALNCSYIEWC